MEILIFCFWLLLALIPGFIATGRGRSFLGWFLLGLLLSPLISSIIVLVIPNKAEEKRRIREQFDADVARAAEAERQVLETKPCPRCAERVKKEAQVCRFCGHEFAEADSLPAPTP